MCTEEIHQMLIQEDDAINCIFCCMQIQDPGKPKRYFCCSNINIIKERYLVCKNCGQVHDYLTADEYVDFYENRHSLYTTENIISWMILLKRITSKSDIIIKRIF